MADQSSKPTDTELYPGGNGGYNGSEPRELSERTDAERALIDQGHTIQNAIEIAAQQSGKVSPLTTPVQ